MKALSLVAMLIALLCMALTTLYLLLVGMAFSSEPGGQGSAGFGGSLMLALPLLATLACGGIAIAAHLRGQLARAWGWALAPIAFLMLYLALFAF